MNRLLRHRLSRSAAFVALLFALGVASLAGGIARADDSSNPFDGQLHVDVTPYVWLPTINATFRHPLAGILGPNGQPIVVDPTQTFDTTIGPNQLLAKLNFAAMGAMSVHYRAFALYGDFLNLNASGNAEAIQNIGNTNYTIGAAGGGQVVTTLWTLAAGFNLYHSKAGSVDIIAGDQTLWVSTNGNATLTGPLGNKFSGGFNQFKSYSSFVAGTLGQVSLGGKWAAPFFFDYGFNTPSSVQWLVGVKYGKTQLSWRTIQYNAGNSQDMLQHLNLSGPLLGYTLSF